MPFEELKRHMLANAAEIVRLRDAVHETFRRRDRDEGSYEAWRTAAAEFRERYDALAFPGGYDHALERLSAGDAETIDAAIAFLECRPYFFRSGYMRTTLLRRLKRVTPGTRQEARVAEIVEAERARRARSKRGTDPG